MRVLLGCLLLLSACTGCDPANNTAGNTPAGRANTARDNTAVNQRDSDGGTKTPFDQSNTTADTELVAKLRSEVLKIDKLSINGRNIKIITNDGKVVLRGPVESAAEHDSILKVVNGIAGESNVTDDLEVKVN